MIKDFLRKVTAIKWHMVNQANPDKRAVMEAVEDWAVKVELRVKLKLKNKINVSSKKMNLN